MRTSRSSFRWLFALVAAALLMTPFAALADTLTNNVVAGGNDTIIAGTSTTIAYTLNSTSGDGQNGCNAPASSPATMTISKPAAVIAPPSVLLAGCGVEFPVVFSSNTPGNYLITVSVSGGRGGSYDVSAASFTLKVLSADSTPPVLSLPGPITKEATGPAGATVSYAASATDAVDGAVSVSCSPTSGSTFPLGTTKVACSAKDSRNNQASGNFSVTVVDTTGPAIADVPANITIEAESANGAVLVYTDPTAKDLVDGTVNVNCAPASGSTFALGVTHTVTCSAKDSRGNASTGSFSVLVEDTTAPLLMVADATEEATGPGGAKVGYSASAKDLVDGLLYPTCSPSSGSTFLLGATTVACSVADSAGNSARATLTVTVVDTTKPSLKLPANIVAEATGPSGAAVSYSASASDLVDGDVEVSCTPVSGSTFGLGNTKVSCTATDNARNTAEGNFYVDVIDTTAPSLKLPADIVTEATGPSGAAVSYSASASDLVDGQVGVSCLPDSGEVFPLGTTEVTCSAYDSRNNIASRSFNVTVEDTTAPALSLPGNIVEEAGGPSGNAVTYTATALDIVNGAVTVSCVPPSGSTFALGTTTVNCSASDASSNTASGSFTVKVQDTIAPAEITFIGGIANGASFFWGDVPAQPTCTATDGGSGLKSCVVSGYSTAKGSHTLTATAEDNVGNKASTTLSYQVLAWTFSGFYQPVDMNNVMNTVKSGATVPIKFELFKGSTELTTTSSVVQPLKAVGIACSSTTPDDIELVATGGTSLRYDATAGQFIYNWQTPSGKAGSCYKVTIFAADGSSQSAIFKLK